MLRHPVSFVAKNALALILSSVGTAALGFVFWAFATRLVRAEFLGRATAEIAAMSLVANLSQLGFGSTFERFLPIAGSQTRSLVVKGYALSCTVAFVGSLVYLSLPASRLVLLDSAQRLTFVISTVAWSIFVLQDRVLIALRKSSLVPVENLSFSAAKLVLLPVIVAVSITQGIYLSWTIPVVAAVAIVSRYVFWTLIPRHASQRRNVEALPSITTIIKLALGQYVTTILRVFSTSIVALIVIATVGATASAYYYIPAMISSALGQLIYNVVTSFLVESSFDSESIGTHARSALRVLGVVLVSGVVIGEIFASQILRVFGSTYAAHGTTLLRLLLLSLPALAVTEFYAAFAWLDRRVWWLAGRELVSLALYLGLVLAFIGRLGIIATGWAALGSAAAQALFFAPILVRRYRSETSQLDPS